jgi:hypothetical protein
MTLKEKREKVIQETAEAFQTECHGELSIDKQSTPKTLR